MLPKERKLSVFIALNIGALIGALGIVLQFHYMLQVPGVPRVEAVIRFFSFFTILTNILVFLGYACPLLLPQSAATRYFSSASTRGSLLVSIVVVGAVYNLLLRQLYHPQGWAKFADILVHDAAPAFYVLFWCTLAAKDSLRWTDAGRWLIYPLAYLGYILARGAVVHYYPYPFVDVAALGYERVLINAAGLTAIFYGLGLFVVLLSRASTIKENRIAQGEVSS